MLTIGHYHSEHIIYGKSLSSANIQIIHWQDHHYQQSAPITNITPPPTPRKDANNASPIKVLRTDQGMIPLKFTQKTKNFTSLTYRARSEGLQGKECALKQSHWNAFGQQGGCPPHSGCKDGAPSQSPSPLISSNPSLHHKTTCN